MENRVMYNMEVSVRSRRAILGSFFFAVMFAAMPFSACATGSVTLVWSGCTYSSVVGYNIYYGGASGTYTNAIYVGNTTNATISGLVQGTTYYFAATSLTSSGMESPFSSEVSYLVPLNVPTANQPPTLNTITNLSINENAGLQTVSLSGITVGDTNGNQTLTVTAVSSNTGLIPNPTVHYTNPGTTGSLTFTPAPNGYGTATITVTVNDNSGASNSNVVQTFTVTVNAVNQPPTLNAINSLTINENAGLQTVPLSGITSGAANENQTLAVTATSSNTGLIPNPTVNYTPSVSTGSLTFTPAPNGYGTATITVKVTDSGTSNNVVTRMFTVTVNATNPGPTLNLINSTVVNVGAGMQIITLTGISSGTANQNERLRVTASCSNQRMISRPTVRYINPATTGTLTFWPGTVTGTATVSVTVNNGQTSNNTITRSFAVTVVSRGASTNLVAPTAVAANLSPASRVGGQFAMMVAGAAGHRYVIEASTDLVNWVPVQTNTAPFTFVDPDANRFDHRFYRSVYIR
jgi:hypothetical protein